MTSQQTILRSILNLTSGENQREQRRRVKHADRNGNAKGSGFIDDDLNDFDDDEDDQKICVGADGIYLEKSLFKMKILVYDQ